MIRKLTWAGIAVFQNFRNQFFFAWKKISERVRSWLFKRRATQDVTANVMTQVLTSQWCNWSVILRYCQWTQKAKGVTNFQASPWIRLSRFFPRLSSPRPDWFLLSLSIDVLSFNAVLRSCNSFSPKFWTTLSFRSLSLVQFYDSSICKFSKKMQ